MWWLVWVSQRRHSEVTQGCWRWPGTLCWVEWALSAPQLRREAQISKSALDVTSLSHIPACISKISTHRERWRRRWPSGNQIHWRRCTGRQRWTPTAHCWESQCRHPPSERGPRAHLLQDERREVLQHTAGIWELNSHDSSAYWFILSVAIRCSGCKFVWYVELFCFGLAVSLYSLSMRTPLTNQVIFGLGSPLTRQVRLPVSLGARIRFLGALTQKGAAVDEKKERNQEETWHLSYINLCWHTLATQYRHTETFPSM